MLQVPPGLGRSQPRRRTAPESPSSGQPQQGAPWFERWHLEGQAGSTWTQWGSQPRGWGPASPHGIRDWSRTFSWAGAPEGPSPRLHVSRGLPRLRCVDLDERGFSAQPAECGVPRGTGHPPRLSHRETRPASRRAQPRQAPSFSCSRGRVKHTPGSMARTHRKVSPTS